MATAANGFKKRERRHVNVGPVHHSERRKMFCPLTWGKAWCNVRERATFTTWLNARRVESTVSLLKIITDRHVCIHKRTSEMYKERAE